MGAGIKWVPGNDNLAHVSKFSDLGSNATANVKASAGNVFAISIYNANASARFFQLHNTATTPAGAAVPFLSFLIPATGMLVLGSDYFSLNGVYFSTGIAFAFSTTANTYTAATAGEQTTSVLYV